MAHGAVEVALALHTAIVLAAVILELDTDPVAGREQRLANEADGAVAAIAQPDGLPGRKLRHSAACVSDLWRPGHFEGVIEVGVLSTPCSADGNRELCRTRSETAVQISATWNAGMGRN